MTIRLQILQNQPEHIWNQRITKPAQLSLHPSQVLKRDTGKGDRFKADWQARKGARLKTWQWQVLATVFFLVRKADMEGNWFFFSPLWEMSFSTRPWQFSNDGRLDTIKCDTRKAWLRSFFFSPEECQRQYECMITAAAERPICHSVCLTAQRPWNCPEVAIGWPLAKIQSRLLKGNTSKSDSVNLLLWHACTEKAPDYP